MTSPTSLTACRRTLSRRIAVAGIASLVIVGGDLASSQEMIPRTLLVEMARNQFSVLCQSDSFASCMGFSTGTCLKLSETAIAQCLLPLPAEISPKNLQNRVLESCPKSVFAKAGFTEEKAGPCFDQAMQEG
ncbi:MAG: hypothetical protein HKN42_13130 [Granulosicoccus sp.]|nr:hypothetical protein [Granulosicoccus sp.]